MGKTQLSMEYAYRHASEYDLVWWVRAEDPATLAADYALLARELDLPEQSESNQAVVKTAVRRWLEQHQGWLLIFDNAQESLELRPYLPQGGGGHVVVTSRNPVWGHVAQRMLVQVLRPDEAVAFLLKRTDQTDATAAATLAEAMGDLPLALEQAGAYIEATGRSLAEYVQMFQTHQQELLRRGLPSGDYPATVVTTWELAFQQISTVSAAATALLHLCAFLAAENISRDLLSSGAEYLPQSLAGAARAPLAFDDALEVVLRYSLLQASDGGLAMHRLVQAVARDRLDTQVQQVWAVAALRLVNAAFPYVEVQTWPICAHLLPHALAVSRHAQTLKVEDEANARLLNQVGSYLQGRAQFTEARDVLERALAITEKVLGPDHPDTALSLNNLGLLLQDQGDLAAARPTTSAPWPSTRSPRP